MKSNTPIDFAIFQLSPRRSRCELFVSSAGNTEKLASGLVKPFLTHLKVAEEQAASTVQSIKLEVERFKNAETWFTKGTLERFVRFVSTPEVLELVNTFDAEMSQLEAAQRIYSQGAGDQLSSSSGGDGAVAAADATKKELLRAIDVRLVAVRQDLTTSYTRAAAAGFTLDAVSELQLFADRFGASRLNEACSKFISLCHRRPDLINPWKTGLDDRTVRSSCGSDMSIDDDPPDELRCGPPQDLEESKPTTWQQPTKPTVPSRRSRESSVDRDEVKENEVKKEQNANQEEPVQTAQLTRRLSVQDRINLFENKQKETSGGSGSKSVVGKSVELRRLSSDVSSAPAVVEKAVLRRWSGASDMSIDLGGEKKEIESPLRTPPSSSVSQAKSEDHESKGVTKQDEAIKTKVGLDSGTTLTVSLGFSQDTSESTKLTSNLERVENDVWKYQTGNKAEARTQTQSRPFRAVDDSLKNPVVSQTQSRPFVDARAEQIGSTDQRRFKTSFASDTHGGNKEQVSSERQLVGNMGSRGQSASQSRPVEIKENIGNPLASQAQWGSSGVEEGKKALGSSEKQSVNFATGAEHGPERMKIQKQVSVSEQNKRPHATGSVSSSKMASESQEDSGTFPAEQVQRVRQAKGNQELNDELKMKANELEKLFAEHKLRVPLEQSSSAKRNRTADIQIEQEASRKLSAESAPAYLPVKNMVTEPLRGSSNMSSDCATPPVKLSDNQNYGDSLKKNFSAPGLSDDSRGKFYDKYMQKRDAKLREEWGSKRAEKEAKMKTMHDSFERSRKEMKTKFAGSSDKKDLVLSAYQRAERLRSFNTRSAMKREQHPIEYLQGDGEDLTDLAEMTPLGHVRSLSETSLGDSAARSAQIRRPLPSRNLSTSTPRTSAAPVPKSAAKVSNTISGRRRMQSENPLAQSVPNFSDFRKENTKPSSGVSKPTRLQARNHARSRSTNEDIPLVKEEKSRRSQYLRKSSAGPVEFKQFSSMDSDGVGSNPLNKEQNEFVTKDMESKPFLRKGNGIGPGAGAVIAKMKASMASDDFEHEESDAVKYEEEEESEVIITEDYSEMDNEKRRLSEDSDKLANSDSESGDALRSFSQVDPSFATEASTFHPTGSLQDSPTESPVSWNLRIQNAFAYAQETSDVDASADSPLGSPASWNSHSLNQAEADAARMRKKWGSAQKPFLVSNSSVSHPRKDVTKGFKRLLKFGRKSRGTDNLVDWISATTSEGDDDTEDGRDPGNRSSEDLRKSRMGFPQSHPSDDGFNESDFYTEQVQTLRSSIPAPPAHFKLREDSLTGSSIKAPRSFFSLSSFRSKASDSKPR